MLALRLPFTMADRGRGLPWVVRGLALPRQRERRVMSAFAMTRPEHRFALELLERKRNLWLYRCNQRRSCGDFAIIDMSVALPLRAVTVLELKTGAHPRPGGGGLQVRNAAALRDALAREGVLELGASLRTLVCDPCWTITGPEPRASRFQC